MNSKKRNVEQVKDLMELNSERPELLDVPEQSESHSSAQSEMDHSLSASSEKVEKKCPSISVSHAESEKPHELQARKEDIL